MNFAALTYRNYIRCDVIYECVFQHWHQKYSQNALLVAFFLKCSSSKAARRLSKFIACDHHNRGYVVTANPDDAVEHQLVVIDCLRDSAEVTVKGTCNSHSLNHLNAQETESDFEKVGNRGDEDETRALQLIRLG
jgi:hypothetical protein